MTFNKLFHQQESEHSIMLKPFTWSRYGGYECSTKGDPRFSAFNAVLPDGRTIEHHYQCDIKGYDIGGTKWQFGKGKPPLYPNVELWSSYLKLWEIWANDNPELIEYLAVEAAINHDSIISDRFANSSVNQARALAEIINKRYGLI